MFIYARRGRERRNPCASKAPFLSWAIAALLLAAPSVVSAQTTSEVSATVVSLDNGDLILDLAIDRGARPGDIVELWRPLKLRHPVTKKLLEDRFRIGSLRLVQVGESLTLAQTDGKPMRQPEPGDIVVLRVVQQPKATAPTDAPAAAEPVAEGPIDEDPEAARLSAIFDGLRGTPIPERIRAYEDYVRADPNGRFAVVLYEEAQSLRQLLRSSPPPTSEPKLVSFRPPEDLLSETAISLGIEADPHTSGAVLHTRTKGDDAYLSVPMQPTGPGYWSAQVPAETMRSPGLEYFIEGMSGEGTAVALVGAADRPERAAVRPMPKPVPPEQRDATFSILTDYADYNRLRGDDYAWQTEGYFGMRYREEGVRAVRTGFGVYRGAGGTLEDLDVAGKEPRRIGLTYGYLELEYGITEFFSVIGRGAVGLEDDGTAGGGQGMIRIGNDRSTNLMLGGEFLGGVGLRGFTQLELNTFERVPILLRSEVTNQPAGISDLDPRPATDGVEAQDTSQEQGDLGARGIVQVGYRVIPNLTLAGRVSYQGRTIKHAGPGVGAAVTYGW